MNFSKISEEKELRKLRVSKEKIQEISEAQYKKAMKHVEKMNNYEIEKAIRQKSKQESIDIQCTFHPILISKRSSLTSFSKPPQGKTNVKQKREELLKQTRTTNRLTNQSKIMSAKLIQKQIQSQIRQIRLTKPLTKPEIHNSTKQINSMNLSFESARTNKIGIPTKTNTSISYLNTNIKSSRNNSMHGDGIKFLKI